MRIAIVTDCWFPQVDGIVRTIDATVRELRGMGHDVLLLTPADFYSVALPYGDRLVVPWYPRLARMLAAFQPVSVHMATQGPLGFAARTWCTRHNVHYTTAFHTRFPEYARIRHRLPEGLLYWYARFFHGRTAPVMVPSKALADHLRDRGIGLPKIWERGVDTVLYRPRPKMWTEYARPILLYVGRVVDEKNVRAFLELRTEGTKIVAGDGPLLASLRSSNPGCVFLGALEGEALARCYSEADVFVFPSLLDTFGLVVLEALASGLPVAAFPSPHLTEIFAKHVVIVFDEDLDVAVCKALEVLPARCVGVAMQFSWRACTQQFVQIIADDMGSRSVLK